MTLGQILGIAGPVVLYAAAAASVVGLAMGPWRGRRAIADAVCLFPLLLFVLLTQYPFPDPQLVDCTDPRFEPILQPFHSLRHLVWVIEQEGRVGDVLRDRTTLAAIANFGVCVVVGAGLFRFLPHWRASLVAGLALSLGVEITQLTGMFGIYPCAVRQFDVDDLILNVLGVVVGYLAMGVLGSRRATP